MAQSCKAVAALGDCEDDIVNVAYEYGKQLGLAFQVVDDLLDYSGDPLLMGKAALALFLPLSPASHPPPDLSW